MTGVQWISSDNLHEMEKLNSKNEYGRVRSASLDAPFLIFPSDGQFLNTPNTELVWSSVDGAFNYNISVFDESYGLYYEEQTFDTAIITPDLTEGSYYWQVQAIDEFNEGGVLSETWIFHIDFTLPQSTHTIEGIEGENGWYTSSVLITLTAEDYGSGVKQIQYSIGGGAWEFYDAPIEVSQEGPQSFFYYATDNAMNEEIPQTLEVALDLSPPSTTAVISGDLGLDYWFTSIVTVILTATDSVSGSGVQNIFYSRDLIIWELYTGPVILEDGLYNFGYYSTDFAGQREEYLNFPLYVDQDPPYTVAQYNGTPGSNGYYRSSVEVSLIAEGGLAAITATHLSLDGMNWTTYSSSFPVNTEGDSYFYAYSEDIAGNVEEEKMFLVQIDYSLPTSTITLDGIEGYEGWYISPVGLSFQAEDLISGVDKILYQIDNDDWMEYSEPILLALEGNHIVKTYAIDRAGNIGITQIIDVNIDLTPPTTTLQLTGTLYKNLFYISAVTVELVALDPVSGVEASFYSRSGVKYLPYQSPFTITESGEYTIFYYSRDIAGNQEMVKSKTFIIDTNNPHTNAFVDGNLGMNGWYISSVEVNFKVFDPDSIVADIFYSYDQVDWFLYNSTIFISTEGITDLYYYANDSDGNVEPVQTLQIKIDTQLPVIDIYVNGLVGENGWYISAVSVWFEFYDDTSGISELLISYDGVNWFSYLWGQTITPFSDQITHLFYTGIDAAGLQVPITIVDIKQDLVSPTSNYIIEGVLGTNSYYTSPVSLTLSTQDSTSGIASFVYSRDGISWQSYSEPLILSTEGSYFLSFYAVDFAGNIEPQQNISIFIDLAAPTSAFWCDLGVLDSTGLLHVPVEAPCYMEANDTFSGVAHIYYRINADQWLEYQGSFNFMSTGEYTLEYYSIDHAGWAEPIHTQAILVEAGIISQQFQGIALFQYNRQLYCGLAVLGVNNEVISLMIDNVKFSWNVTEHNAEGNWETFTAENSYCTIYIIIYHGRYASYTVAVGCPLIFLGYYCD